MSSFDLKEVLVWTRKDMTDLITGSQIERHLSLKEILQMKRVIQTQLQSKPSTPISLQREVDWDWP